VERQQKKTNGLGGGKAPYCGKRGTSSNTALARKGECVLVREDRVLSVALCRSHLAGVKERGWGKSGDHHLDMGKADLETKKKKREVEFPKAEGKKNDFA